MWTSGAVPLLGAKKAARGRIRATRGLSASAISPCPTRNGKCSSECPQLFVPWIVLNCCNAVCCMLRVAPTAVCCTRYGCTSLAFPSLRTAAPGGHPFLRVRHVDFKLYPRRGMFELHNRNPKGHTAQPAACSLQIAPVAGCEAHIPGYTLCARLITGYTVEVLYY